MNTEYKLSGKAGNLFLVGTLLGPALITLLCIIYAYIDIYNPLIYFTVVVFLGLLLGILIVQKLVIRLAKCRDTSSAVIYGLVVGVFGVYANWCTFVYVFIRKEDYPVELMNLMANPVMIFDFASALSVDGYFTLFGITIKGGLLWLLWIVEAIGIMAAGALGGLAVMHEEIFCEECNRWAEDTKFNLRLAIEYQDEAKKMIESDIEKILDFPIHEGAKTEHIRVNLHQCSTCQNTATIDVDLISYKTNDKGEVSEKAADFSNVYILNKSQYNRFMNKKN